ncbi:NUDIX hydrolase [Vibrio parahaemolyticus]|uniref:NUDIX hydrolase n=1 Tax=Vibrio parahaemolyticus TaxID=670 RepID=UPI00084B67E3|nr:NUDIX hydrolase [Vibrio parahaemolyticus]EIA0900483.1 NUDIX hydrolase [Vibrio parahaemolyticus]EID0732129.1 NUDIX hydrolase [Vibrio parahaemolyticus]EIK4815843.1 NUDIX hydrolase [Vibrio parahaemolyticus]EJG1178629.1 NUDIX hydrolase [Vibrio parahaemolyticus]ODW45745.1 DNA mismatch repair protein MutT [Vibrio parahaemolyticus]
MQNLSMAVVVREGKILVQERFRRNKGMVFEFPGGSVDKGESGEQAAVRELWEETGVREVDLIGSHSLVNEFGGSIHYVVFLAQPEAIPQMVNPVRQQTFHWFNLNDIPRKDFFKADIEFLDTMLEQYL